MNLARVSFFLACAVAGVPAVAQDIYVTTDNGVDVFDGVTGDALGNFVPGGSGGLSRVTGVAAGSDGRLYVASADTDVVSRFDASNGNFIDDFLANPDGLRSPMGMKTGPNGNIFIANRFLDSVVEADPSTGEVIAEYVGDATTLLITPEDIAFDAAGLMYVASANTNTIVTVDINTGLVAEFIGAAAGLDYPHGLDFDDAGNLFVSSHFGDEVLEFDSAGNVIDSFAVAAPVGVLVDTTGVLNVVSFGTGAIARFDAAGNPLTSLTTSPDASYLAIVDLPRIVGFSRVPSTVVGSCQNSTLTITIDRPAPAGGTLINLTVTSNAAAVSVPATAFIAEGTTTTTATATSNAVATSVVAGLRAQTGGSLRNTSLTVNPIGLASGSAALTATPVTIPGGTTATGTVTMFCPVVLADAVVALSSDNAGVASVPATVTVPIGAASANFAITTTPPAVTTPVTLSASFDRVQTRVVNVTQGVSIQSLTFAPSTVVGGNTATGTITLTAAAGVGGAVINLVSANPGLVSVPATATVLEGNTTTTFTATTTPVSTLQSANVTASFGASSKLRALDVRPPGVLTHVIAPNRISLVQTSTGTVTLEAAAPAGGIVVTLTSENAAVAVPAVSSITITQGNTSGTYQVNPVALGTTRIIAASGTTSKLARITVQ